MTVSCPALTVGTITSAFTNVPPDTAATVAVDIIAAATLFSTVTCAITNVGLVLTSNTATAYAGSLVSVSSIGYATYDSNVHETADLKIKYTYNGANLFTNSFTVTSTCPAPTTAVLSPVAYTEVIPNTAVGSNSAIFASSAYASTTSTAAACLITYQVWLVPTAGSETHVSATTNIEVDATGSVKINTDLRQDVLTYRVKWTHLGVTA